MDYQQIMAMLGFPGQARAPNTVDLRNQWMRYASEAQMNGIQPLEFEQWAQQNYPDRKIINQPQGLLNQ